MLVLLIGVLMIVSILILCRKRSKESFFLSGMCISLLFEFCGILIFIAKKGGYSREMLEFLFVSMELKTKIQYFLIPLDVIGFLIALGRYLFPFFLLQIAMSFSMIPMIRRSSLVKKAAVVIPVVSLIVYYPSVYKTIISWNLEAQNVLAVCSYLWIVAYILLSMILLGYEYFSITMVFCRRQFRRIVIGMISLSGLYLLYCGQDPGQVYRFYSYTYAWSKGIGYMQYMWEVKTYYVLLLVSVVCSAIGFVSLFRYTQQNYVSDKEEMIMERKYNTARVGTLVFVHSTKNQLLANRVIFKRLNSLDAKKEEDVAKMQEYIGTLEHINESLLKRMEELYRSVKSSSIYLTSCYLEDIVENAMERFRDKCPDAVLEVNLESNAPILADKVHLCEAIYNLLTNAQDAVDEADRGKDGKVWLLSHDERLYTVIEVKDNGIGISRSSMKKIVEPYYTSKNRNYNWGMGLYYVRGIVKGHLGDLRVESTEGEGSSFYILLPKYSQEGMK